MGTGEEGSLKWITVFAPFSFYSSFLGKPHPTTCAETQQEGPCKHSNPLYCSENTSFTTEKRKTLTLTHTHVHTHTHTHTHTQRHTHTGFPCCMHSIGVMFFIQTAFSIALPTLQHINLPLTKNFIFRFSKKHNSIWFISLFPYEDKKCLNKDKDYGYCYLFWGHFVPIT